MASSIDRLSKEEIKTLSNGGKRRNSPHFSLIYGEKDKGKKDSFTVVVSKKITPLAVKRNLLKRRIWAIFRNIPVETKGIIEGIVIAKRNAHTLSHSALKEEIITLLKKV